MARALQCRVRIGFEPALAGGGLPVESIATKTIVFPKRDRPPGTFSVGSKRQWRITNKVGHVSMVS